MHKVVFKPRPTTFGLLSRIMAQPRGLGQLSVSGGSPTRTPLFFSNHSTALGNGTAALLDNTKAIPWTQHGGGTNVLNVETVAFPGWPTPRALRVRHINTTPTFYWLTCNNVWAAPAVGQSRAFRVYLYNPIADTEGNLPYANTHPMESEGGTGAVNGPFYAIHYSGYSNGTFPFLFAVDTASFPFNGWCCGPNSDPLHPGDPSPLNKSTAYIIEWIWTKTSASPDRYTLSMRVTTAADLVVRFDNSSIRAWGGSSGQTLAASGTNLPVDDAHVADWRYGINGGFQPTVAQDVYWGGFGVADGAAGFIGPYGALTGEV